MVIKYKLIRELALLLNCEVKDIKHVDAISNDQLRVLIALVRKLKDESNGR